MCDATSGGRPYPSPVKTSQICSASPACTAMHPAPDRLTQQSRLDRVGEPHPDRDGQARTRRAGATPALRAFSYWELIHIGIKKLGRIERGAGARVVGMANRGSGLRGETPPGGPPDRRLGVVHIDIDDCSRLACRGSVKIARHPPWSRSSGEWSTSTQAWSHRRGGADRHSSSSYCSAIRAIACRMLRIRQRRYRLTDGSRRGPLG
jgi:hypothetical protein